MFVILLLFDIILSILWGYHKDTKIVQLLVGILTIFILFSFPIVFNIKSKIIKRQANYSFAIYIMHWPVILLVRILVYQILKVDSFVAFCLMLLAGYLVPNLIIFIANKIKKKYNIGKSNIIYYLIGI